MHEIYFENFLPHLIIFVGLKMFWHPDLNLCRMGDELGAQLIQK